MGLMQTDTLPSNRCFGLVAAVPGFQLQFDKPAATVLLPFKEVGPTG